MLGSWRGPGGCGAGAAAVPDSDGLARSLHVLRPERPTRSPALHPFRDSDDRRGLRRSGHSARRAGAGVPPRRLLRRSAACPPRRNPGRRGQNFFTHSGVEHRALPRVAYKTMAHSVAAWWNGDGFRLRFRHGGSTLTQQLVRGYFLRDRSSREGGAALFRANMSSRLLSAVLGVPATNKLLRKLEEMRLSIWLEQEMRQRFGSQEQAKREIFARAANFNYLGNGRYGFAAASEYYFGRHLSSYTLEDAGQAALLAGITKSPR